MNDPQIPAELAAEQQQTIHTEHQALQKLAAEEQQRLDQSKRLRDSLKSIAGNADFEHWMTTYLAGDVAIKLQQMALCPVEDIPLARQRWLDAKNMLADLQQAVTEAREK